MGTMFRAVFSKLGFSDSSFSAYFFGTVEKVSSSSVLAFHTEVIDKNLSLKMNEPYCEERTKRLCIMFTWMMAKGKHIDKYCALYLQQDIDVLVVSISPQELMFPTTGSHVIAQKVLDYIESHPHYEKLMVHAFSVGAYLFGECLVKIKDGGDKYVPIANKFAGIICDSAIDYYGIPNGLAKAMFNNPLAANIMKRAIDSYMWIFYKMSTRHYIKCSQVFHNCFLKCPSLILTSKTDPVTSLEAQQHLVNKWVENGIDARLKCWENSAHVSHMHAYPEEYTAEVIEQLTRSGFLKKLL